MLNKINYNFSKEDKEKCKITIVKIVDLANLARRDGILALEMVAEKENDILLKTGLMTIVDGTGPELVREILENLIWSGNYSGHILLNKLILIEGVLAIQLGHNPRLISLKLGAMLGEDYIVKSLSNDSDEEKISEFWEKIKNNVTLPECEKFEAKLINMDNRSIQTIWRNMSYSYNIVVALYGCSAKLIKLIFSNMSSYTLFNAIETYESTEAYKSTENCPPDFITEAQEHVLKTIQELEDRGEIIVSITLV